MKSLIDDPHDLELRSPEVQDIMSRPPAWIIRWGITVITGIVAAGLLLTWLVKYPDILPARLTLTTNPPPLRLVAPSNGQLTRLLVADRAVVEAGTYLAVLENPAEAEAVLAMERQLDTLSAWLRQPEGPIPEVAWLATRSLGSLQAPYAAFRSQWKQQDFFARSDGFRLAQGQALQAQIQALDQLNQNLDRQIGLLEAQLDEAEKEFRAQEQLARDSVIAPLELARRKADFLGRELALEQLKASRYANQMQRAGYQRQVDELRQGVAAEGLGLSLVCRKPGDSSMQPWPSGSGSFCWSRPALGKWLWPRPGLKTSIYRPVRS